MPFILLCLQGNTILSQSNTSSEILDRIKKLNVLGSVLYVAAHPDDENTRLITYLSKGQKLRTAYVSMTRGDGGQNLIGPELDEFLGVIRTNELMEARKIDGGMQFFTRANDFGYSKNAEETFSIWEKDTLLYNLVRIIREFKPDVIINRFDHRTSGKTHGHHTASAILGLEAYRMAGNPLFQRDKMADLEPLVVPRIFFNTSYFFFGSKEKFDAMDKSFLYSLDVGEYYPSIGYSNGEISARSRSMHKSQGFGINSTRGRQMEYFERIDQPKELGQVSPFDGLDFTWSRINGGGNIQRIIDQVIAEYKISDPSASIPLLQKAEKYIAELPLGHWRTIKLNEIQEVIALCAGIYAEAMTDQQTIASGNSIRISTEFIARSSDQVKLIGERILPGGRDTAMNISLQVNVPLLWTVSIDLKNLNYTTPYWLLHGRRQATYPVEDPAHCSSPIKAKELNVEFSYSLNERNYTMVREVIYKNDDPVAGEVRQPFEILPEVTIAPFDQSVILASQQPSEIKFTLQCNGKSAEGSVRLDVPGGLIVEPQEVHYSLKKDHHEEIKFTLKAGKMDNTMLSVPILVNGQSALIHNVIKYSHIPWQHVATPAVIKISKVDLKVNPVAVAYVQGAGDYIDETLLKLGYAVKLIAPKDIRFLDFKKVPVLIFGIRAWNTQTELPSVMDDILRYAEKGGRVIFQYNTTAELLLGEGLGTDFKISRDRVTDEHSPVRFLRPEHPVLNRPNKIVMNDFNEWVQERGLYFPNSYSSQWQEILAMGDQGEAELKSGILIQQKGKGVLIYTPLAWFRQLPSGIPGACRLFINLVSY
ncbi:MAG: PIG-L family deacetylase [Saprospiraceae bacterium]|nr:PIG-L family deacetylase [Saprospiraceae bacterium]HMW38954.1 PIG-L family deacetylase [Saprospiraceae bacterium]HMX87084.1 PIG-L family deacetylase [Saprospiraceae bacterium]HMZ38836.1 PIG-L family deacetylase [Saprospiraceae bacterium]HNA63143.1 PIG-L family deacetylase [Saprospiraceae bacterium]